MDNIFIIIPFPFGDYLTPAEYSYIRRVCKGWDLEIRESWYLFYGYSYVDWCETLNTITMVNPSLGGMVKNREVSIEKLEQFNWPFWGYLPGAVTALKTGLITLEILSCISTDCDGQHDFYVDSIFKNDGVDMNNGLHFLRMGYDPERLLKRPILKFFSFMMWRRCKRQRTDNI